MTRAVTLGTSTWIGLLMPSSIGPTLVAHRAHVRAGDIGLGAAIRYRYTIIMHIQ